MKNILLMKFFSTAAVTPKRFHFSAQKSEFEISHIPFKDSGVSVVNSSGQLLVAKQEIDTIETKPVMRTLHNARKIAEDAIIKNCPDVICALDRKGRFLTINDACVLWGYSPEEIEGKFFTDFVVADDIEKTLKAACACISTGKRTSIDNRCAHKEGHSIPMLWSVSWSADDNLFYCSGRDASDIKSAEISLQESTQRYRSLFDYNPDAVYSLDLKGNFTSANAKVAELTGCPIDQILTMSFVPFVDPEYMSVAAESFRKAAAGEKISYDLVIIDISGNRRHLNISNMPMIVHGKFTGIYGVAKDISESEANKAELKKLNESLEMKIMERTSQLEQSIKEMEAFSYSVSHDLRAPLRIINGYTKLLSNEYEGKFDADGKEFMTAIIENTKYMSRLIDDLLNLSRLGREAINKTIVDMNLITQVVIHELKMEDNSIVADFKIQDLSPTVCDQRLIRQVWTNLISNAIKYSKKKGTPQIEIGSYEKGNQTVYYIKDNGAGFDMKFAAKLFGVFVRLHDRSEFDGTGVGLALVQRIISKHGGKVWANGKVDEGAVFYFSLPNS